jgi:hypothetical protein
MPAGIKTLVTQPERLRSDQGAELRQLVLDFPDLPGQAVSAVVATIDRQTAARNGWTFVMLSPAQNRLVIRHIQEASKYPTKAVALWAECFMELRHDTGEIVQTREQLAEQSGVSPAQVSTIMNELTRFGAVIRRLEKVPGMSGPGVVRYFMNPRVGTKMTGAAREHAQAEAPALRVVDGYGGGARPG